jgi:hypothetical protein
MTSFQLAAARLTFDFGGTAASTRDSGVCKGKQPTSAVLEGGRAKQSNLYFVVA